MAIRLDAAPEWEFVEIPAGEFMMGASPEDCEAYSVEKPSHRVLISRSFQLGRFPVTQAMWESVMRENPSRFEGNTRPVECVSWNDVQGFLQKLNDQRDGFMYRLPTEAEWKYAARAGTTGPHYGDLHSIAWFDENSGRETHPVGEKLPNLFGLHDMLGNVGEWCQDWNGENYYGDYSAADPKGPSSGQYRVLRGGSWYNSSRSARVSNRNWINPVDRDRYLGFRVCREKL